MDMTTFDMSKRIEDLLDVTERLIGLIEEENLALEERRSGDVEARLEEKTTLSRLYHNRFQVLKEKEFDWNDIDAQLRADLKDAGERLAAVMKTNELRLKVAVTANKKILGMVAKAVEDTRPHSGTYSRKGVKGKEGVMASANSLSLAVDQVL